MLDGECLKSKKEVSDLKDQLAKDEHLIDELRQDNYNMKQRLVESEGQKEGAKREIQNLTRKLTETEEDNRVREKILTLPWMRHTARNRNPQTRLGKKMFNIRFLSGVERLNYIFYT